MFRPPPKGNLPLQLLWGLKYLVFVGAAWVAFIGLGLGLGVMEFVEQFLMNPSAAIQSD
jgi:hypothetical protein